MNDSIVIEIPSIKKRFYVLPLTAGLAQLMKNSRPVWIADSILYRLYQQS